MPVMSCFTCDERGAYARKWLVSVSFECSTHGKCTIDARPIANAPAQVQNHKGMTYYGTDPTIVPEF